LSPHFNDESFVLEVVKELVGDRVDAEVMGEEEGGFGAVGDLIGMCALRVKVELESAVNSLWVWWVGVKDASM
jgi:hypothetical protein